MFGYIRPVKAELKVREFEHFKACYCGLCHTLGKKYGLPARFIINYDFVYLSMLLWPDDTSPKFERKLCPASPCKKRTCCCQSDAFVLCSGYSVILAWWKLRDNLADKNMISSLPDRFASIGLRRAYQKASKEFPDFDGAVKDSLARLGQLEKEGCPSIDRTSDQFAGILRAAADGIGDEKRKRVLRQILYHTGRWIYIVDACDDLSEDAAKGRYNPVAARFGISDGKLSDDVKAQLERTLLHSVNLAGSAFELLKPNAWSEIIKNIIYLGMPEIESAVFDGKWQTPKKRAPK